MLDFKSHWFCTCADIVFKFVGFLVKEEKNHQLVLITKLQIIKNIPKAASEFLFPAVLPLVNFLRCTQPAFRTIHKRIAEQLLESQAATLIKTGTIFLKRVTGVICRISE